VHSFLEVGCNKGHNLDAINEIMNFETTALGIDIRKEHCTRPDIIHGSAYDLPWYNDAFDFTFTSGVLIHIPPGRLEVAMNELRRVSNRYVLMIEYYSEKEKGTKYEKDFNYQDGVWSRPYGEIYQGYFKEDELISTGKMADLGNDGWAFSKCDYWIFEKK
jgi:SAM-dependent methyltransferase